MRVVLIYSQVGIQIQMHMTKVSDFFLSYPTAHWWQAVVLCHVGGSVGEFLIYS